MLNVLCMANIVLTSIHTVCCSTMETNAYIYNTDVCLLFNF